MRAAPRIDTEVIAEWKRRSVERRRRTSASWYAGLALFIAVALPPVFGLVAFLPYELYVLALAGMAAGAWRGANLHGIRCPNCGKVPVLGGQSPLAAVESCAHCQAWLVDRRESKR